MERLLLVVGARPGSLGDAIAREAMDHGEFTRGVVWADIHPDCRVQLDVTDRKSIIRVLEEWRPTDIVCTAGINLPDGEAGMLSRNLALQFQVNAWGPMQLLSEALDLWDRDFLPPDSGLNFAAVSSNSAHIARSESAGYCASKAALSMAVRCTARKWATTGAFKIWGYEPGWINGTPMSDDVRLRLKGGVSPHRIPGNRGVDRDALARRIVEDVRTADRSLNGTMIRIDGGEQ